MTDTVDIQVIPSYSKDGLRIVIDDPDEVHHTTTYLTITEAEALLGQLQRALHELHD